MWVENIEQQRPPTWAVGKVLTFFFFIAVVVPLKHNLTPALVVSFCKTERQFDEGCDPFACLLHLFFPGLLQRLITAALPV